MSKIRVMIVEDEPGLAITLAETIRQASKEAYEVLVCNSPQEALVHLANITYDLVISDYRLPGMTGLELIGRIRMKSPGTHTILMTGYGSQDVETKAQQITDAYLTKPFDLPEVLKLIQRILSPNSTQKADVVVVDTSQSAARKILDELCFETRAPYAMLFYLHSSTVIDSGDPGAIDKTILSASLISSMNASNELAQAFNEKRAFDMHYYDGDRYEIHLRKVNAEIVLTLLIDLKQTQIAIGGIRLHLKRAVESVKQISEQLLAAEKGKGGEKIESLLLEEDSPDFFNSLDDLLFSDAPPSAASTPQTTVNPSGDEPPTRDYFSLDEAIRQGMIKIEPPSKK